MTDSFETILFPKQSRTKIGKITYIINSYFDNNGRNIKRKNKKFIDFRGSKKIRINSYVEPKNTI